MSEMNTNENKNVTQNVEAYLRERQVWIQDAVEIVAGDRNVDPTAAFLAPTEVRADAEPLDLTEEQEASLREVAGRFGLGGEVDVKSTANHQILEGGKPWKVEAESKISEGAKTVIFAGSPNRILGADETTYVEEKFGVDLTGKTEYDMVRVIAAQEPGFDALGEDQVLPFGYDIQNGHQLINEPTGQLVRIGTSHETNVLLLRVDRENYKDEEGKDKYRNQPDSAALMGFVADVLSAEGDETSSVGLNTSNTYASRAIDAPRAGLAKNRTFDVGMYGRETLADVQDKPVAEPAPINQIPGELHAMHAKLQQLQAELGAS